MIKKETNPKEENTMTSLYQVTYIKDGEIKHSVKKRNIADACAIACRQAGEYGATIISITIVTA